MAENLVKLYHRTGHAEAIMREGFRDTTGNYMTSMELTGVWFSADFPLDGNEGAKGNQVLELVANESEIEDYEVEEEGKPYREYLVPAKIANTWPRRLLTEEEVDKIPDPRFDLDFLG
jgi:hypothetical protein